MEARFLRLPFRNLTSLSYLLHRLRNFSSSSSAASLRTWNFFSDDPPTEGESSVYQHTLKFQRPSTIEYRQQLHNSVSFIGTVDRPLKPISSVTDAEFGAYTFLNIRTSSDSKRFFKIVLMMWNDVAKISIKHLKPNDCIYVSGHLGLYTKVDDIGKLKTHYKVIVKEINYVVGLTNKKYEQSDSGGSGETPLEKYKNRLHLWQVFFANPSEWLDYRRNKVKPNHPDFKNKDTGEALWIRPNDPIWIKKQLQLHDSRSAAERRREDVSSHSDLSPWIYDD